MMKIGKNTYNTFFRLKNTPSKATIAATLKISAAVER